MTLIAAAGRCDWCGKGNNLDAPADPLPVIAGEHAFCSTECRDLYAGRGKLLRARAATGWRRRKAVAR
jgi:hypothetical protein